MQNEVEETYTNLVKAFINLRLKPNKDLLSDIINQANGLNAVNYTAKSWNLALVDAKRILDDPEATVEEVTNAKDNLARTMIRLVSSPSAESNLTVTSLDSSAKTGDEIFMLIPTALMILSASAYYITKKSRY